MEASLIGLPVPSRRSQINEEHSNVGHDLLTLAVTFLVREDWPGFMDSHCTINERNDGLVGRSIDGQVKRKTDGQPRLSAAGPSSLAAASYSCGDRRRGKFCKWRSKRPTAANRCWTRDITQRRR